MNDQPKNGENGRALDNLRRGLAAFRPASLKEDSRLLPAIYIVVFVVLSVLLFPPTKKTREVAYNEGDIADVDVISPFTFVVPLSDQEVEINRARAAVSVPPVYRMRSEALEHLPGDLTGLMERIKEIDMRIRVLSKVKKHETEAEAILERLQETVYEWRCIKEELNDVEIKLAIANKKKNSAAIKELVGERDKIRKKLDQLDSEIASMKIEMSESRKE